MAPPAGRIRPGRYLSIFVLIVVVLYALVFFTGGGKPTPKLGIDLQGGTRVTLSARTPDGSAPSKDSLNQARQIIEKRVNGIGVSGTEVILDGNNIVITVPGEQGDQAKKLGQTAKLGFRKVLEAQTPTTPPTPAAPGADDQSPAQIQQAKATRQDPGLVTGTGDSLAESATAQQALAAFTCSAQDPLRGNDDPNLPLLACNQDGSEKYLLGPVFLQGTEIDNAVSSPMRRRTSPAGPST